MEKHNIVGALKKAQKTPPMPPSEKKASSTPAKKTTTKVEKPKKPAVEATKAEKSASSSKDKKVQEKVEKAAATPKVGRFGSLEERVFIHDSIKDDSPLIGAEYDPAPSAGTLREQARALMRLNKLKGGPRLLAAGAALILVRNYLEAKNKKPPTVEELIASTAGFGKLQGYTPPLSKQPPEKFWSGYFNTTCSPSRKTLRVG